MDKPHVVLLGAGASYAAFPNGDKNGKRLPLMMNFVEAVDGVEELFKLHKIEYEGLNFEDIYSKICVEPDLVDLRVKVEQIVYEYFRDLELPEKTTIYDKLVLSLRAKDVIATFNWDPFLILAYRRNYVDGKMPTLHFLHGNVMVGHCPDCHVAGVVGSACSRCGNEFAPSKLLYPVNVKEYHKDQFINQEWKDMGKAVSNTFMLTVFGYSAPVSDESAIMLLKKAWGDIESREFEQTEIIDIKPRDELRELWKLFIHTDHCDFRKNFEDSWVFNHPRRTGEAYMNQYLGACFIEKNPIPESEHYLKNREWFDELLSHEPERSKSKK